MKKNNLKIVKIDKNKRLFNYEKKILINNLTLDLKNDNFTMDMGMTSYEKLDGSESDRYQYILPYYK